MPGVQLPVPAAVRGTTEGECSLISKHVHRQLARCNPLFHFLVLVPTGFVLVGQKNNDDNNNNSSSLRQQILRQMYSKQQQNRDKFHPDQSTFGRKTCLTRGKRTATA